LPHRADTENEGFVFRETIGTMAQPLPQGSVRRVRGVSPTSDLQKLCGAEFSQAGKQGPVYTACEAVNQKSGTTLHCLPSCEGPHPEPPVQNPVML